MRKRYLTVMIALALISLVIILYSKSKSINNSDRKKQQYKQKIDNEINHKSSERNERIKDDSTSEALSPNLLKMKELIEKQLAEVKFFGKVIDQNGLPVKGVNVEYAVSGAAYGMGGGMVTLPQMSKGFSV